MVNTSTKDLNWIWLNIFSISLICGSMTKFDQVQLCCRPFVKHEYAVHRNRWWKCKCSLELSDLYRSPLPPVHAYLIYFFIVQGKVLSITLGVIPNASVNASHGNMTIDRLTCDECLCEMINGSSNVSILAFNCLQYNGSQVTCQLFTASDYDQMSWFTMLNSVDSSFYFSELPTIPVTGEILWLIMVLDVRSYRVY